MGMDVYGKEPRSLAGEYVRYSVWGWKPIVDISFHFASDVMDRITYPHTNDGDGLNGEGSVELADILQANIDNGAVAQWILDLEFRLASLPNETCRLCDGSGVRDDATGITNGQVSRVISSDALSCDEHSPHPRRGETGWCNGCDGRGFNRPIDTYYTIELDDVACWTAFLRDCRGFEIW